MVIEFPSYASPELSIQIRETEIMILDRITHDVKQVQPLPFQIQDFELLRHNLSTKVAANGHRYFQIGNRVYELAELRRTDSDIPKFSVIQLGRIPGLRVTHWTASLGKIFFDEADQCLMVTNGQELFRYSQNSQSFKRVTKNNGRDVFEFYVSGLQNTIAWTPGRAIFVILNNGRGQPLIKTDFTRILRFDRDFVALGSDGRGGLIIDCNSLQIQVYAEQEQFKSPEQFMQSESELLERGGFQTSERELAQKTKDKQIAFKQQVELFDLIDFEQPIQCVSDSESEEAEEEEECEDAQVRIESKLDSLAARVEELQQTQNEIIKLLQSLVSKK